MCEQPYLKQGHVLLVVLLALLGGGIAAVDEGTALLRVTVTCERQTPPVRRLTHRWFFTSILVARVRRVEQRTSERRTRRNVTGGRQRTRLKAKTSGWSTSAKQSSLEFF